MKTLLAPIVASLLSLFLVSAGVAEKSSPNVHRLYTELKKLPPEATTYLTVKALVINLARVDPLRADIFYASGLRGLALMNGQRDTYSAHQLEEKVYRIVKTKRSLFSVARFHTVKFKIAASYLNYSRGF